MRIKILQFILSLAFFINSSTVKAQAINTQDSLALVDLYNSTNGPGWVNHTNWLTNAPVSSWFGIGIMDQRVAFIDLRYNKLTGSLPISIGNLSSLMALDLSVNQLTGIIPTSIGTISTLFGLNLRYNQLSGAIPAALTNLPYAFFYLEHNQFTFGGLESLVSKKDINSQFIIYYPQANIPLNQNGNILSVSAGGILSNNTYQWYKDNTIVSTKIGDSTYSISSAGNYSVVVTNSKVWGLSLYSITPSNIQDSLALVDLYNSTNGPGWINQTNWLTSAPLSTWYGVTLIRSKITELELFSNNLVGTIPSSLGNLTNLNNLNLQGNQLSGSIPSSFSNFSNLLTLNLGYNKLTSSIPTFIGSLSNLNSIDLSDNQLAGLIPTTLGDLLGLTFLYLNKNQLTGIIPPSIGNLPNLWQINLSDNLLSGDIPATIGDLTNAGSINLSNNQLSGVVPESLGNLARLTELNLSQNQLTGSIPETLTNLSSTSFLTLNLSNNLLTGNIPDSVGKLSNLWEVNLSNNLLSGPIPSSINKLTRLSKLNIQLNQFTFDGMENLPLPIPQSDPLIYGPQAKIPLNRNGNLFSVSAGGTLANDTFRLFMDDVLTETKTGDSTFTITAPGRYYVTVTNNIATLLTLSSNVSTIAGLVIADSTEKFIQNFNGTNPVTVGDSTLHKLIATITPAAGVNGLSGDVDCSVFVDTAVSTFNNQPYVQRHYDIIPATNPASSLATVMLYFTQQEFDNFNNFPGHGLDLPTGPADAAGKANLRVYQFHGFSATSLPGSYSGSGVEINPADASIVWNAASQFWEVSFEVTGFSGFFVSSLNGAILPVKLLSFTGNVQGKNALLKWTTAMEINAAYFELQRSNNSNNFTTIAKVNAADNSNNNMSYQYADLLGAEPVYFYRLKMVDKDGLFTYSNVIKLSSETNSMFTIYPNPSKAFAFVNLPVTANDAKLKIFDMSGRAVKTIIVPKGTTQIKLTLKNLPNGSYKIVYFNGEKEISKTLLIE